MEAGQRQQLNGRGEGEESQSQDDTQQVDHSRRLSFAVASISSRSTSTTDSRS